MIKGQNHMHLLLSLLKLQLLKIKSALGRERHLYREKVVLQGELANILKDKDLPHTLTGIEVEVDQITDAQKETLKGIPITKPLDIFALFKVIVFIGHHSDLYQIVKFIINHILYIIHTTIKEIDLVIMNKEDIYVSMTIRILDIFQNLIITLECLTILDKNRETTKLDMTDSMSMKEMDTISQYITDLEFWETS